MTTTLLHDPSVRSSIAQRLQALTPSAPPQWGKMSADQMLWHVNEAMLVSLGERGLAKKFVPIPRGALKYLVLNFKWGKSAPTNPALVAQGQHDFDAERARCLKLIETLTARPIAQPWPTHPTFGRMSGRDVSRLHAKHLDHHLKQFGA